MPENLINRAIFGLFSGNLGNIGIVDWMIDVLMPQLKISVVIKIN